MKHKNLLGKYLILIILLGIWSCTSPTSNKPDAFIKSASLLADHEGKFTITDVIEKNEVFMPALDFILTADCDVYWLKLEGNSKYIGMEFVLPIEHADSIIVYSQQENGEFLTGISGENISFKNRMVAYGKTPYISFDVPNQGSIFIKLVSVSPYSRSFREYASFEAEPAASFFERIETVRYFHGIFLGVLLAVILYNIFIYVLYRDFVYMVYIIYMILETTYQLSITGFLREFILPDNPITAKYAPFFLAGISMVIYVWFSLVYLEARKYAPKLRVVLKTLIGLIAFTTLVGFFIQIKLANSVLLIFGLLLVVLSFIIAIVALRKGHRQAIFFLIASSLSYFGYILFTLSSFNLLPLVFVTRYSFQLLFALQALLFAIGLGDRLNRNKKEIARNKLRQLELEKEKETALKNVLEKQNEVLEKKVKERTAKILEKTNIIEKEKQRSDNLLLNILPEETAEELKVFGKVKAKKYDSATVLFTDFVGFTSYSKNLSPEDLVETVGFYFSKFDEIVEKHGLEKIKTIGDAYMCAGGLPFATKDHAHKILSAAFEIAAFVEATKEDEVTSEMNFDIRIGISSGPVVAGVVGTKKFAYDIWGDTVNIAARMESNSERGKINISESTYNLVKNSFDCSYRGEIEVKNRGILKMYFANELKEGVSLNKFEEDKTVV